MPAFLLEVGTEELPADFVKSAIQQWQTRLPQALAEQFLTPEAIEVYGTPRRLAILLKGLPSQQPDREEEIKDFRLLRRLRMGNPPKRRKGSPKSKALNSIHSKSVPPIREILSLFANKLQDSQRRIFYKN
uniref:Glycine--tRNA ligase subunit beta n=1 Tax=Desertifilum tharense IPPAS B-1220 TaxID=1781255 RepID=A0ACD5GND7_9CYAN